MTGPKMFEELAGKLSEVLAQSPVRDLEKNVKALLGSMASRLDLVSREEFDVQQQVLLATREKLDQMEARLAALEKGPAAD